MKRLLIILLLMNVGMAETRSSSHSLQLPTFQEALHIYKSNPLIVHPRVMRSMHNIHGVETDIFNKNLCVEIGGLMLKEADHLLREQPLNEYNKKIVLTIIALLKAQKNNDLFSYHYATHTVTLKKLIDNTVRKFNHQELVPPYIL